jgi:beta-glucosidase
MRIRRLASIVLLSSIPVSVPGQQGSPADSGARIDALVARMTLAEKLGQLSQISAERSRTAEQLRDDVRAGRWGSLMNLRDAAQRAELQRIALHESRLGIPLIFARDVIHGYRTVFPIPLGQSASWDPELVRKAARIAARETAADGIHWTFAPMLDIARDPRWGRIAESLGEDPVLASAFAAAMVRGLQGESLDAPGSVAACAKHYAGYGAAEGGRDYNTTWIPETLLRDVYLPSFAAAEKAGAATFMSAFNDLNGVPASGNAFLLRRVLRQEWGFDGFVVSDWNAVEEMIDHGYAADSTDAAVKSLGAGVDMEMASSDFFDRLPALVQAGKFDVKPIDDAVRNVLRIKFRLGLFDKPIPAPPPDSAMLPPDALGIARQLATESAVLLKNDGGVLPLSKSIARVAVIGPLADSPVDQMGCWVRDARTADVRTPLAAIREMLGPDRVTYVPALKNSRDIGHAGFAPAVEAARNADVALLFVGEEQSLSGEARSRSSLDLPGAQERLVEEIAKAGKPVVIVVLAGRPLTFSNAAARAAAVLYAWHPGTMGGPAIADLLFGNAVPSGKLTVSFPRVTGQVPIYYNHMNTGRPSRGGAANIAETVQPEGDTSRYIDIDTSPEYPFGYGLSYTSFQYSNLKLSSASVARGGSITVSADVTNSGKFEADEVVQLYTRQLAASLTRPVRELKGFERVTLKPGETRTVRFTLSTASLAFHNQRGELVTEPGLFHVWIAPDSARGLRAEFRVVD